MFFQWSVFSCGHCICCQCAWVLLRQAGVGPRHRNVHVKCPLCRIPTVAQEISYVSTARTQTEEAEEKVTVKVLVSSKYSLSLLAFINFFIWLRESVCGSPQLVQIDRLKQNLILFTFAMKTNCCKAHFFEDLRVTV